MAEKKPTARHRRTEPVVEEVPTPDPDLGTPVEAPSRAPEKPVKPSCVLPGCDGLPEWRGLCAAHRQTHRGLAAPKEEDRNG